MKEGCKSNSILIHSQNQIKANSEGMVEAQWFGFRCLHFCQASLLAKCLCSIVNNGVRLWILLKALRVCVGPGLMG